MRHQVRMPCTAVSTPCQTATAVDPKQQIQNDTHMLNIRSILILADPMLSA